MQDEKSQLQNRERAMKVLRARLYEAKLAEQQAELAAERRAQVGTGERAEKIRTYNFPERRVTDHRVKLTVHNLEEVLGGALDEQTGRAAGRREARAARSGDLMARRLLGRTSVRDALDSARDRARPPPAATRRGSTPSCCSRTCWASTAPRSSPSPARELEPDEARAFMDLAARRRGSASPSRTSSARRGSGGSMLAVDPRVLIPRPETEHVVEAALSLPRGARVVDVGTGSGAIALALKDERPDLRSSATDVTADALEVARANAARLGLEVEFVHGDLLAGVAAPSTRSSPTRPTSPPATALPARVAASSRAAALFGGADGLDVIRRLVTGGGGRRRSLALEVGAGQAAAVAELLRGAGSGRRASCATSPASTRRGGRRVRRALSVRGAASPRGGVAVFPADTVYGLACDPENADGGRAAVRAQGPRRRTSRARSCSSTRRSRSPRCPSSARARAR